MATPRTNVNAVPVKRENFEQVYEMMSNEKAPMRFSSWQQVMDAAVYLTEDIPISAQCVHDNPDSRIRIFRLGGIAFIETPIERWMALWNEQYMQGIEMTENGPLYADGTQVDVENIYDL